MSTKDDCLFCKIVKGEIPSKKVYEDDVAYAFLDINPQAPIHILIIPKTHIDGIVQLTEKDNEIMGHCLMVCQKLAREYDVIDRGFRVVINSGREAGQAVFHIHLHLIAGRHLTWPPG